MKSKTSFFKPNTSLIRKNATRYLPLWVLYLLVWIVVQPLVMLEQYTHGYYSSYSISEYVLSAACIAAPIINAVYAALVAMLLYGFLTNSRAANAFHSLPLRRESLFLQTYLSGLLYLIVPQVVVFLFSALVQALNGNLQILILLESLLAQVASYLFFFGLASLCFMLSSHILFAPALYVLLNFVVVGVEACLKVLFSTFLYGLDGAFDITLWKYSPLTELLQQSVRTVYTDVTQANGVISSVETGVQYTGWSYLLVIAGVGILCAGIALLLFRKRSVESAGNIITFRVLRPVFKYAFTFGCSLGIGLLLTAIFEGLSADAFMIPLISMLVGAFIGYFLAEMMLQKTIRVWRGHWVGFFSSGLVVVLVLLGFRFDITGYERRVPQINQVQSVDVSFWSSDATLTNPDDIQKVLALHQICVNSRAEDRSHSYDGRSFRITYNLTNGKTLARRYFLPNNYQALSQQADKCYALLALLRDRDVITQTFLPASADPTLKPTYFSVSYCVSNPESDYKNEDNYYWTDYQLSSTETSAMIAAIAEDIEAGAFDNVILENWFYNLAEMAGIEFAETYYEAHLQMEYWSDGDGTRSYTFLDGINSDMTHILACIDSLGIKLVAQMRSEESIEDAPIAPVQTSTGIIGGADGPTDVIIYD